MKNCIQFLPNKEVNMILNNTCFLMIVDLRKESHWFSELRNSHPNFIIGASLMSLMNRMPKLFISRSLKYMMCHNGNSPSMNITCPYKISYPFINGIKEADRSQLDKQRVNKYVLEVTLDKFNLLDQANFEFSYVVLKYL